MKTLNYPAYGHLAIADQPVPKPASGEVRLRVAACGICGSELGSFKTRSIRRTPPMVMGHEFCGVIDEVGEGVGGWTAGQAVVSNALVPCGRCIRCLRGDTHLCGKRQVFGMHRPGAFAEFVNVPASCLIPWPEILSAQAACLAEPLGNGIHIVNLTQHVPAATVLVLGAGPIGLMCQQAFQVLRGSQVVVADLIQERLEVAKALGAEYVVRADREDVVESVLQWTDGEGADLVVDAVGASSTKQQSVSALRPGGSTVWIGLHEDDMQLSSYAVTLPERHVLGTYGATLEELQQAVDLMAADRVDVTSWVQTIPLDQGVEAFYRMLKPKGRDIKAVLVP